MTHQQILERAIQKTIEGGWKHPNGWTYLPNWKGAKVFMSVQFADEKGEVWHMPIESLIFSHDFAKALWGERWKIASVQKRANNIYKVNELEFNWQYHLQRMVIADDPIAYLGEHLE